uniref:Dermacentor 9 kDa family member n=1 Tax=Rhipicephalus zambeziensis TaxID=60191 RepID=A0A224YKD7_9ACAR
MAHNCITQIAFFLLPAVFLVTRNEGHYACEQRTCHSNHRPNCLMRENGSLLHHCTNRSTPCPIVWGPFCRNSGSHLSCPHQNNTCMCYCNSTKQTTVPPILSADSS